MTFIKPQFWKYGSCESWCQILVLIQDKCLYSYIANIFHKNGSSYYLSVGINALSFLQIIGICTMAIQFNNLLKHFGDCKMLFRYSS